MSSALSGEEKCLIFYSKPSSRFGSSYLASLLAAALRQGAEMSLKLHNNNYNDSLFLDFADQMEFPSLSVEAKALQQVFLYYRDEHLAILRARQVHSLGVWPRKANRASSICVLRVAVAIILTQSCSLLAGHFSASTAATLGHINRPPH